MVWFAGEVRGGAVSPHDNKQVISGLLLGPRERVVLDLVRVGVHRVPKSRVPKTARSLQHLVRRLAFSRLHWPRARDWDGIVRLERHRRRPNRHGHGRIVVRIGAPVEAVAATPSGSRDVVVVFSFVGCYHRADIV
nr:hypothetical protein Iba_chr07fCG3160 [Ipomoea batatas]